MEFRSTLTLLSIYAACRLLNAARSTWQWVMCLERYRIFTSDYREVVSICCSKLLTLRLDLFITSTAIDRTFCHCRSRIVKTARFAWTEIREQSSIAVGLQLTTCHQLRDGWDG